MNLKSIPGFCVAGSLVLAVALRASEAPATPTPAPVVKSSTAIDPATAASSALLNKQVQAVLDKVIAKFQKGLHTEADIAPELAELDALIAAHKSEKTDAVAMAEYYKGLIYFKVNENEKGLAAYKQVVQDLPDTNTGQQIAKQLPQLEPQIQARMASNAAQKDLVVGKPFPAFAIANGPVKDIAGKELSLAQYKGKIVLIDFWATWCAPCMAEMPNVIAVYEKYHSRGFDIIGVSLDHQEDVAKLPAFLAQNKMPWRQFCDGKYSQNELAVKYGVELIPTSYLIDGNGNIIAISPEDTALAPAIEAALAAANASKT